MFYSMTGYGTGKATSKKMEVLCEIKSVNNRFVDISFRGYSLPNDLEEYIKNQIKKKFLRGSFEVKIHDNFQSDHSYELNQDSIRNLKSTLKASKDFKHLNLKLSDLRDIPGLLTVRTSKKGYFNFRQESIKHRNKELSRIQGQGRPKNRENYSS